MRNFDGFLSDRQRQDMAEDEGAEFTSAQDIQERLEDHDRRIIEAKHKAQSLRPMIDRNRRYVTALLIVTLLNCLLVFILAVYL